MRTLIGWAWILTGALAGLTALAAVVAAALHLAPAVVYNGDGKPHAIAASWATVGALGAIAGGLLIISVGLYAIFDWIGDDEIDF